MAPEKDSTTTRRGILMSGAVVVAAATALTAACAQTSIQKQASRKTFVLVHGGWRGGWCWRPTADLLEAQGHKVFAPTLTGLGERSHLLRQGIDLQTHTTDVVNVIKYERLENVVLVGHSVGGLVITPVAQEVRERISSIVFLDAFLPAVGEAANSNASQASRDAQAAAVAAGQISTPPLPAKIFGDSEANWAWIDSLSTPHPLLTLMDKCKAIDGRESIARKTFIRSTGFTNPALAQALAKTKADPTWRTFVMEGGHDLMIEKPRELADILMQVA